jgi:hypothetical protein
MAFAGQGFTLSGNLLITNCAAEPAGVSKDAMIATILRQTPVDERQRASAWRQLSDILAQRGTQLSEFDVRRSLHALTLLRGHVGAEVRHETATAIASHCRFAPLVAFFAADVPRVSGAMLAEVQLSDEDWMALLPSTTPMARAQLAQRPDLSPRLRRALAALGAGHLALPKSPALVEPRAQQAAADSVGGEQIRDLVRRIDRYRNKTAGGPRKPLRVSSFTFEAGADGVIRWAEGVPRGAVIGISLAEPAIAKETGVDGAAAGAFRRRTEIINARLNLGAGTDLAGDWRLSASPAFDPSTGQFRGYRGTARRPRPTEVAYGAPMGGGDSVRQLIHELRSPLNAISGFGQIIAGQMFGPVSQRYRAYATAIVNDAATLQTIIEDIDTSARGVVPVEAAAGERVDLDRLLTEIGQELAPLLEERDISWSITRVGSRFSVALPLTETRRMIGRLLTAIVDVAEDGETVMTQLIDDSGGDAELRLVRPRVIRHSDVGELLDPGYNPRGDAPAAAMLSLGFSLRLVDSLARGCGGALNIGANALTLQLPTGHAKSQDGAQRV